MIRIFDLILDFSKKTRPYFEKEGKPACVFQNTRKNFGFKNLFEVQKVH